MAQRVAILGATGSIGRSALDVIRRHPDRFEVAVLSAHQAAGELDALACEFDPDVVILSGRELPDTREWRGRWRSGPEGLVEAGRDDRVDTVLNALVGIAGLEPTLAALEAGKRLALANKESLVTGGELVLETLARGGGELLPVDSEHSAIHQCLGGRPPGEIRRLIITASGGPFRDASPGALAGVTPEQALAHPTWDMGDKITIDSATLANKALEVIEAHHLYGVSYDDIDVAVHPASIVHSMLQFRDGSTLAQLSEPSMEGPILYALAYPERPEDRVCDFDPIDTGTLEFQALRPDVFPMFPLGVRAGRAGGSWPVVYNAANEVAVAAFLQGGLGFGGIAEVVSAALEALPARPIERTEDVWRADREARDVAGRCVAAATPGEPGPAPRVTQSG